MNIEDRRAVTLAYKCVKTLKWTHSRLNGEYGLTLPTLRRIRDGKNLKPATEEYYTKVFVSIIKQAYYDDLQAGGKNAPLFNKMMRELLFATYHLNVVK